MNNATAIAPEPNTDNSRGPTARGMCSPPLRPVNAGYLGGPIVAILAIFAILLLTLLWWFDPAKANLPLCSFHTLTGFDCPGCGATRATHELLHGRLMAAWHYNALWVLSFPVALYVAVSELRVSAGRHPLPGDLPRRIWFWLSMAAAAVVFFVARNLL